MQIEELEERAKSIRKKIIELSYKNKSSHIGSCLSAVDILTALYFRLMNIFPKNPNNPERDRFILSKGHAALALYAALCERGFFSYDFLDKNFYRDNGTLGGHPEIHKELGIETSTGSLGHGLPVGCGMALAAKDDNKSYKTIVLLSDGECEEGSTWEAILFASTHNLSNLIAFIDYNKLQAFGRTNEIVRLEPLSEKFVSFGWNVIEIDGHDMKQIVESFNRLSLDKPNVIIAHTVKGEGVSFMEDRMEWHYYSLDDEKYKKAMEDLR